jgi:hypothetical protein
MENRERLERAFQILAVKSNTAAQVIGGQMQLTIGKLNRLLTSGLGDDSLKIPHDDVAEMTQQLAHSRVDSPADARSYIDAIIRAHNRLS